MLVPSEKTESDLPLLFHAVVLLGQHLIGTQLKVVFFVFAASGSILKYFFNTLVSEFSDSLSKNSSFRNSLYLDVHNTY